MSVRKSTSRQASSNNVAMMRMAFWWVVLLIACFAVGFFLFAPLMHTLSQWRAGSAEKNAAAKNIATKPPSAVTAQPGAGAAKPPAARRSTKDDSLEVIADTSGSTPANKAPTDETAGGSVSQPRKRDASDETDTNSDTSARVNRKDTSETTPDTIGDAGAADRAEKPKSKRRAAEDDTTAEEKPVRKKTKKSSRTPKHDTDVQSPESIDR